MRVFLLSIACLIAVAAHCADDGGHGGWHEVIVSVDDIERWTAFWTDTNGWELVHEGPLATDVYAGGDGEPLSGREAVLRSPGSSAGYVRLIRFDKTAGQIRPNAQSWDTGGWFDFNVRVTDIQRKAAEMLALGWHGYSDPVEFEFGPFVVREWLAKGPDGVVIAMIERVRPPLDGWPEFDDVSRVFNATQVVADFDASVAFYREVLGFQPYLEHEGPSRAAGPNVLGLPHNLTTEIPRRVVILHPEKLNLGSVEILAFDGAAGRDFGAATAAPRRGILALRFPGDDLPALRRRLRESSAQYVGEIERVTLPPYGDVQRLIVRGPAGEQLEFVSSFAQ